MKKLNFLIILFSPSIFFIPFVAAEDFSQVKDISRVTEDYKYGSDEKFLGIVRDSFNKEYLLIQTEFLTADKKPMVNEYDISIIQISYGEDKLSLTKKAYGKEKKLKINPEWDNAAMISTKFFKALNFSPTEISWYDTDGKLTENNKGIALLKKQYDENGFLLEIVGYDAQKRLKEGGCVDAEIHSKNGITTSWNYWSGDLRDIALCRLEYDKKGNTTKVSFYGPDEKLKENKYGIAMYRFRHDNNGNIVEKTRYGEDEKVKEDSDQVAIDRSKFDRYDRLLEESFYNKDGKLVKSSDHYALIRYFYKNKKPRSDALSESRPVKKITYDHQKRILRTERNR